MSKQAWISVKNNMGSEELIMEITNENWSFLNIAIQILNELITMAMNVANFVAFELKNK